MDPSLTKTLVLSEQPVPETAEPPRIDAARYEDLGLIAVGGMGEVRRARDRVLDRQIVIKVLRPELSSHPQLEKLFLQEARLTAGLQHPHVVPVHELGRLPDGRLFFSMKEVHGHTLISVLRELHLASRRGTWGRTQAGWTFRRVVDVFHQVALTVAYAHARGVVHGDLKPENVMVGPYGEVQVVDWGLASYLDPNRADTGLAGTPAYMAPEQASGAKRGVATDVYALGATLYEILAGAPPYADPDPQEVLRALRAGERPPPFPRIEDGLLFAETRDQADRPAVGPPPVPRALAAVVAKAMAPDPRDRHRSATSLAEDVLAFVEGTRRYEEAAHLVSEATGQVPEIARLRERAELLRRRAADRLATIPRSAPDTKKRKAWALQDEAASLEREAELRESDLEGTLRGVLNLVPDLPAAHAALAEQLRARHEKSERTNDIHGTSRLEVQLRAHALALPPDHPARAGFVQYLKGEGSLTLHTSTPAEVVAHKYEVVDRRLVPVTEIPLGRTPLDELRLPLGSYLLTLQARGRPEVRYPVLIERNHHWSTIPPGSTQPEILPIPERIPADARYVPAGWTIVGGGGELPVRRVWIDGFVIDRDPVTNARYLEYLNALVAAGRADEAERHVPRERTGNDEPRPVYAKRPDGTWELGKDQDGDEWNPEWPVILVDWNDAQAYASWRAERDGLPWRLPSEWEREKAARGVDGRSYPWGEQEEDTWSGTVGAAVDRSLVTVVDQYPVDVSPYGMRGCTGNVHDWCLESRADPTPGDGERVSIPASIEAATYRALRGGGWHTLLRNCRLGLRSFTQEFSRLPYIGFRLVYPVRDRSPKSHF